MKRLLLLFALLPALAFSQTINKDNNGSCSSCLPDGIHFQSQWQINNLKINYPGCTEIEGYVRIDGENIINTDSLANLSKIGGSLLINDNSSLLNLNGLNNLTNIGQDLKIYNNPVLTKIDGLNSLTTIERDLKIEENLVLTDIKGLKKLASVGLNFYLSRNDSLLNLKGLRSLTSINWILKIRENFKLTDLDGLNNLTSIGSGLNIAENRNLTDLDELINLTYVGNYFLISSNNSLLNILGLSNVNTDSLNIISISFNQFLAVCEAHSICHALSNPRPNLQIHFVDNAWGCDYKGEVIQACALNTEEFAISNYQIKIFPNPAQNEITILSPADIRIKELSIFNQAGQKLFCHKGIEKTIDISEMQPGLYFIEITTNNSQHREKLIIQ